LPENPDFIVVALSIGMLYYIQFPTNWKCFDLR